MTCPLKEADHEIVIGCFIDMEKREISYAIDGEKQDQKYQMDIINVKYAPYIRLGPGGECQVIHLRTDPILFLVGFLLTSSH